MTPAVTSEKTLSDQVRSQVPFHMRDQEFCAKTDSGGLVLLRPRFGFSLSWK